MRFNVNGQNFREQAKGGFTLAELLVSVAILGVIAAFVIPKLLYTQQQQKKYAVFKETLSTFSGLAYMGNQLRDSSYFPNYLNSVKICTGDSTAQGCFPQTNAVGIEGGQPGVILHNGATITGFSGYASADGVVIDWNGADGPNTWGDDQLRVLICFDQGIACGGSRKAGMVYTVSTTDAALYQEIFSH